MKYSKLSSFLKNGYLTSSHNEPLSRIGTGTCCPFTGCHDHRGLFVCQSVSERIKLPTKKQQQFSVPIRMP